MDRKQSLCVACLSGRSPVHGTYPPLPALPAVRATSPLSVCGQPLWHGRRSRHFRSSCASVGAARRLPLISACGQPIWHGRRSMTPPLLLRLYRCCPLPSLLLCPCHCPWWPVSNPASFAASADGRHEFVAYVCLLAPGRMLCPATEPWTDAAPAKCPASGQLPFRPRRYGWANGNAG